MPHDPSLPGRAVPLAAMASGRWSGLLETAVGPAAQHRGERGHGRRQDHAAQRAGRLDPALERVVTIEDAAELRLPGDHVVRLEARPAERRGPGAVTIRDLVRNALRMRPDRIVVGECRAGEALDMLQAMNTGHEGSLSTCHANGPDDALRRLETMALMADVGLPLAAVREQIAASVDLVVHVAGRRRSPRVPSGGRGRARRAGGAAHPRAGGRPHGPRPPAGHRGRSGDGRRLGGGVRASWSRAALAASRVGAAGRATCPSLATGCEPPVGPIGLAVRRAADRVVRGLRRRPARRRYEAALPDALDHLGPGLGGRVGPRARCTA